MGPESVGLLEVRSRSPETDVAQEDGYIADSDSEIEDSQPPSRPTLHRQRSVSDILSGLRSMMASWTSEKSASATVIVEYLPSGDGTRKARRPPRIQWTWRTWLMCLAVVTLLFLVVSISEKVAQHFLGPRRTKDDPLENWGKPGTGTEELAWYPTDFLRDVVPLPCHSHNDYWRKVPLFTALYAGCTGVEADVWLRHGDLLVGHDTASLQASRTFHSLYVNPLVDILTRQNPSTDFYNDTRNGVFDTDPGQTLVLLVDVKTDGDETWPWVMEQLGPLRERGWLSYTENGQFRQGPITVVGTGNTPFDLVVGNKTSPRDAFFDAPLDRLEGSGFDATNSYYASVNFWDAVGQVWWKGEPSEAQLKKIRTHLREARSRELVSRYWGLPAWPIHVRNRVWQVLVEEGIGMLNVDDLDAATKQDWTKPGTF